DDPVVFIMRDWRSLMIIGAIGVLLLIATL
ncbi:MAG: hypothetical protein RL291_1585, partial [Pseudomonadota bacterium]